MAANHGSVATVDAMTEPRPRLTNKTGNVQQTSVVSDDSKPKMAASLFRIHVSLR
jgi:hypothetical protein